MAQDPPPNARPPEVREVSRCICNASRKIPEFNIEGFVIDAEVTLGADRRSVEDRMATIFDTEDNGRTKVHHYVSDENCGVTFDYGKKYTVAVRRDEDGELETDRCLMGG